VLENIILVVNHIALTAVLLISSLGCC